jgi:Cu/Ag efflux protein CusF
MRRTIALTAALMIALLTLDQELKAQASQQRTRYFCGIGRVVSIDDDKSGVTIAHRTIEGYMPAMTMHFKTADAEVLSGTGAGDQVRFTLKDTPELTRLIYIEKVASEVRQKRRR